MIKLKLINADIIYDIAIVTSRLFRKTFNCRYNPRMDYAFCLLTLKSSEKGDPNYLVLQATSITKFYLTVYYLQHSLTQMSFIYCHLNFHANLSRPWRFPLKKNLKFKFQWFYIVTVCYDNKETVMVKYSIFIEKNTEQPLSYHWPQNRPRCMALEMLVLNWDIQKIYSRVKPVNGIYHSWLLDLQRRRRYK